MNRIDLPGFEKLMAEVAACYDRREYSPEAIKAWFRELEEFPFSMVSAYIRNWIRTKTKAPVIADIVVPLADRRSDEIETKAREQKSAFRIPTPVTEFGRRCIAEIKEKMSSRRAPGPWWAYEIRDMDREGRPLYYAQVELAMKACGADWLTDRPYAGRGQKAPPSRQPGEDDE